jgi:hypothetical protein
MRPTVILGVAFGVAAWLAPATAAELVVIESTSPRYVAGQLLDDAVAVVLVAGESMTLVTEDGRVLTVDGPHSGPAAGPEPEASAVRRALAQLLREDRPTVGGVGGVRGDAQDAFSPDTRPDPWLVHAQKSGDQCVLRGREVGVWREETAAEAVVAVGVSLADGSAEIRFGAGAQRGRWPANAPPSDETVYLLRPSDSLRSVPIRLHVLEPALADRGLAAAAWLAARGCVDQARVFMRNLPAG